MRSRTGAASTSLILGLASLIGVGVAGGMVLTGTTPCDVLSACTGETKTTAVADKGDATTCPVTGQTMAAHDEDRAEGEVVLASNTTAEKADSCCALSVVKAQPVATTAPAQCSESKAVAAAPAQCSKGEAVASEAALLTLASAAKALPEGCSGEAACTDDSDKTCSKGESCHKAEGATVQTAAIASKTACASSEKTCSSKVLASKSCPVGEMKTFAFAGGSVPMVVPASLAKAPATALLSAEKQCEQGGACCEGKAGACCKGKGDACPREAGKAATPVAAAN